MADKIIKKVRVVNRHDTSDKWSSNNPILLNGEIAYETDTKKIKIGDGVSNYNDLDYVTIDGLDQLASQEYVKTFGDEHYQQKEAGKGLSTNDFTNELKEKAQNAITFSWAGKANGIPLLDSEAKIDTKYMPDTYMNIVSVDALPISNQKTDVIYYVSVGGDSDANSIVNGTKEHMYRWIDGAWKDIDSSSTAKTAERATSDKDGNEFTSTYLKQTDAESKYVKQEGYIAYSEEEKSKLASLENYTLPIASSEVLGGVKIGKNLTISEDGTISAVDAPTTDGFITEESANEKFLSKEDAAITYIPLTGGTVTGSIKFGSEDNYIDATNYTGIAAKATADKNGNEISSTYATKTELSGKLDTAGGTITGDLHVNGSANLATVVANSINAAESFTAPKVVTGIITGNDTNSGKFATYSTDHWVVDQSAVMSADPSTNMGIATKQYVDNSVTSSVGNKVDKEDGKGLSTNDFTNEYKSKVDNAIQNTEKGTANGVATLDRNGKLNSAQLPDGWDDIVSVETLPSSEQKNDVLYYVTTGGDSSVDTISLGTAGHMYRYVGSAGSGTWVDISSANTADKAVHDDAGNVISEHYISKDEASSTYETIESANQKHNELRTSIDGKVDKVEGKQLSTEDYTTEEKSKLASLENYTLPAATTKTLGGVKVGSGLKVAEGLLSVAPMLTLMNTQSTNANVSASSNADWINLGMCTITYTASTISKQPTPEGILFNIPGAEGTNVIFQLWLAIPDGYVAARAGDASNNINTKEFVRLGTEGIIPGGTIAAEKQ